METINKIISKVVYEQSISFAKRNSIDVDNFAYWDGYNACANKLLKEILLIKRGNRQNEI